MGAGRQGNHHRGDGWTSQPRPDPGLTVAKSDSPSCLGGGTSVNPRTIGLVTVGAGETSPCVRTLLDPALCAPHRAICHLQLW